MTSTKKRPFRIALLCGGPSLERGISLNSARSVCDHLQSDAVEIVPIYFDHRKKAYRISQAQLYSNTPSDFDFKLQQTATPLTKDAFLKALKKVDIVFPAMHGSFGEDGKIQKILEDAGIPFVGTPSSACKVAFDKYLANEFIAKQGFSILPSIALLRGARKHKEQIEQFFRLHRIKRAIVKPATGGSSIAVYSVSTVKEAYEKAQIIFSGRIDTKVVVEPFCEGVEFTTIILENRFGMPVSILPTEIELDYRDHQIFDYRKKYLASRQVTYHCPPRFDDRVLERIQTQAEQLYRLLGMRDFARFDGWLLPDGRIWFSDFNPISGMEQNSFLFMQAARIGMSHRDVLRYILKTACRRYDLHYPEEKDLSKRKRKKVQVIFGGQAAERQVSLMSGTNVWLKLRRSEKYDPQPYLLDLDLNVWHLPYAYALNHTVEEIIFMCKGSTQHAERLERLRRRVLDKLRPQENDLSEESMLPRRMTLKEFIQDAKEEGKIVFVGLHGGFGEDGTFQKLLEEERIPFNGPGSVSSKMCMNKYVTGEIIESLSAEGIYTAGKRRVPLKLFRSFKPRDYRRYFEDLVEDLQSETIIVKPIGDGCSSGIARLYSGEDLRIYCTFAFGRDNFIPAGSLTKQLGLIEMPSVPMKTLLFEEFVITDRVTVKKNELLWEERSGWIEITVGLLEEHGRLRALNPSITVALGDVLSLEEKFQGGTGINITPPPTQYVSPFVLKKAKARIEKVAAVLGIQGYSRIDAFLHVKTGELIIIEANTLPGLTPATVIYHQALAEKESMYPIQFLEKIVEHAEERYRKSNKVIHLPTVRYLQTRRS